MKFRIPFLLVMAAALLAAPAMAQVSAPSPSSPNQPLDLKALMPPPENVPTVLSLEDAIKAAIARNYAIQSGQNTMARNQLEVTRAKDAFLPSASATANYGYSYSLTPVESRASVIPSFDSSVATRQIITPAGGHTLQYNVGANFNIYNGGADAAHVRSAQEVLGSSQNNLIWARQTIAFNVTSAYLTALRNNELVAAAQKTLDESQAQLDRLRGLYQAGSIPIGQVYQQEALKGKNHVSLIQARNNFENSKADLLFLLNVSPNNYSNYTLGVTGIDTSTSAARRAAIDTTVSENQLDAVIRNRPDITAAQLQIQNLQDQIDITRAALLPRLDATAGIGGNGNNSDLFKTQVTNRLNAGLNLAIPLFDRNQNRLAIQEQDIDVQTQQVQLEQAVQQIRSDAAKAVNNLKSAEEELAASRDALVSAEESLRLAEERLRVGAGTQVDVIIAEAQLETARTNQVNSKYDFVLAQRQLQFILGQWNY